MLFPPHLPARQSEDLLRGDMDRKVACVLCQRSEETRVTGNLLTEGHVTAHHNCMLYASDIYCKDSPEFGDLSGFRAEDVQQEAIRGRKLICHGCKSRGATVGCEVMRCKKSYHYPCAIADGAKRIDDEEEGKYGIFCPSHSSKVNSGSMKRHDSLPSSCSSNGGQLPKRPLSQTDVGWGDSPSKRRLEDWFPTISDDSMNTEETEPRADMDMYAPIESDTESEDPEQQNISEVVEDPAGPPPGGQQEDERPDENGEEDAAAMCSQETDIESDESQSLLLVPVELCVDTPSFSADTPSSYANTPSPWMNTPSLCADTPPSIPNTPLPFPACFEQSTTGTQTCLLKQEPAENPAEEFGPVRSVGQQEALFRKARSSSPPGTFQKPGPPLPTPPRRAHSVPPPPPSPLPASGPEPGVKSSSFWKSCNATGRTRAIFDDFFREMSGVAERILLEQASDEDYDVALSVLAAMGKLPAYVSKQQEELQRKQQEVGKACAAMLDVVAALKKIPSAAGAGASASL
ncbi:PHD finger protein 11 isoform X2 [Salarias fasciatus]|uniref:PHD finger protein 11 isoform X2 n=1 Tax=Salarias fasciatus TaxID=181472 RepID=UPI0011766BBC|nr:PHD finger protein 11-like isoform X2 [Salarias fasciatus]